MKEWFDDPEVYSWFGANLQMFPDLAMQSYVKAKELKAVGLNWQTMTLARLPDSHRVAVELLGRSQFSNEADKVEAFDSKTGASRSTFFTLKKRFATA